MPLPKWVHLQNYESSDDGLDLLLDSGPDLSSDDTAPQPRKKPEPKKQKTQTQDGSDSEDSVTNGSLKSRCLKKDPVEQKQTGTETETKTKS